MQQYTKCVLLNVKNIWCNEYFLGETGKLLESHLPVSPRNQLLVPVKNRKSNGQIGDLGKCVIIIIITQELSPTRPLNTTLPNAPDNVSIQPPHNAGVHSLSLASGRLGRAWSCWGNESAYGD